MIDSLTASVLFIALSNLASAPAVLWMGISISTFRRGLDVAAIWSNAHTSGDRVQQEAAASE